jgi:hypothetical protein
MGCSSSVLTNPVPENICGDGDFLNMTQDVEAACFFTTEIGAYCDGTSQKCFGVQQGATEWVPAGAGESCGVCSSCKGAEQGPGNGLCGYGTGSCSWAGARQKCQRIAFKGDPLACCRRSKNINGTNLFCFDDNSKIRTCDPQFRGFLQPSCVPIMEAYCSDNVETSYPNKWVGTPSTRDCLRFVQENTNDINFYKPVIDAMVRRYLLTENRPITSYQSNGNSHDPFIDTIVQVCRGSPGACDDVLKIKCAGVQREELANNVNLANLCGCFMPDIEYAKLSSFGIDRECDPVCAIGSAVPYLDPLSSNPAKFKKCTQSICVIDDVTINILANSVAGDISFSQACGSCASNAGTGSCRCYIQDVDITTINSKIGDVTFSQQCGGAPLCYKSAPVEGAPPIQVDCNTGEEIDTATSVISTSRSNPITFLWIALGVLAVLIIIIFLVSSSKSTGPSVPILIPGEPARETRPLLGSVRSAQPRPLTQRK